MSYTIFIRLDLGHLNTFTTHPTPLPTSLVCQPIGRTMPVWLRLGRVAGFKMSSVRERPASNAKQTHLPAV